MNGHVFQCFNECEDKKHFSKTVEALGEYIAKKLKYPGDMVSLTKDDTYSYILVFLPAGKLLWRGVSYQVCPGS